MTWPQRSLQNGRPKFGRAAARQIANRFEILNGDPEGRAKRSFWDKLWPVRKRFGGDTLRRVISL